MGRTILSPRSKFMGKWLQQMPLHQKVGDLPPLRQHRQTSLESQVHQQRLPETDILSGFKPFAAIYL
jgi:hypothetical protein